MTSAPFRTRTLTDPNKVFEHNAWDDVEWDDEQEREAQQKVDNNSRDLMTDVKRDELESDADKYWDKFYSIHQNRFFKDRNWLFHEFPELLSNEKGSVQSQCVSSERDMTGDPQCAGSNPKDDACQGAHSKCESNEVTSSSPSLNETHPDNGVVSETKSTENNDENTRTCKTDHDLNSSEHNEKTCTEDEATITLIRTTTENSATTDPDTAGQGGCKEYPGQRSTFRIFEVGCGVGNTVFPVLQTNNDPGVFVYCCDLSSTAIQLVKEHHLYDVSRCHAFVGDVTNADESLPFPENSLDFIIMIFVISAIHPDKFESTFARLARCLKPGGMILFRDYGRYDLAQLRFKNGQCLSENFYARQDGTRVYFFTQEELNEMFTRAGLTEVQNSIDRRLQVNRRTQQKMYRVWIQCKYQKPYLKDELK